MASEWDRWNALLKCPIYCVWPDAHHERDRKLINNWSVPLPPPSHSIHTGCANNNRREFVYWHARTSVWCNSIASPSRRTVHTINTIWSTFHSARDACDWCKNHHSAGAGTVSWFHEPFFSSTNNRPNRMCTFLAFTCNFCFALHRTIIGHQYARSESLRLRLYF